MAETKKLFFINTPVSHESGGFVIDQMLVTGPETPTDIRIIDFYLAVGNGALMVYEGVAEPPEFKDPNTITLPDGSAFREPPKPTLH